MLLLNTAHFLLGLSRSDEDFSDIQGGMTASYLDYQRIIIRIIAIITTSPSVHLRQAIIAYRAR